MKAKVLGFVLLASMTAISQSQASYNDTMQWITKRLVGTSYGARFTQDGRKDGDTGPFGYLYTYKAATVAQCEVTWTVHNWNRTRGANRASEVDFNQVTKFANWNSGSAKVKTRGDGDVQPQPEPREYDVHNVQYEIWAVNKDTGEEQWTRLATGDAELAPRLANAVNRAIELCGGKPEPF